MRNPHFLGKTHQNHRRFTDKTPGTFLTKPISASENASVVLKRPFQNNPLWHFPPLQATSKPIRLESLEKEEMFVKSKAQLHSQNSKEFVKDLLLILDTKLTGTKKEIFEKLFENHQKFLLQTETNLDASLTGNVQDFNLQIQVFDPENLSKSTSKTVEKSGNTEKFVKETCKSYLKLLINSKDELSLAKIICSGPQNILNQTQFKIIEKESGNLPMYQTIMSYCQKLKLGGKSYAPDETHPFHEFSKELCDFSEFMSKLYEKMEDETSGEKALSKILHSLKCQLLKTLKQSSVEKVLNEIQQDFQKSQKRWKDSKSTCQKMILLLIDFMTTKEEFDGNLAELFGKIQPKNDEFKTPILNSKKILTLYKTPEIEEKTEDPSLIEATKIEPKTPKFLKKDGRPKFTSTLAWAAETSPLILRSNEKNLRTEGTTLAMPAESSTPKVSKVIENGLKAAEEALKEAKNLPKPPKISKRSILKDIKNVDKWSKMEEKQKKTEEKKRKLDLTGAENAKIPVAKKKKEKKQPALLKGQTKMTAFLRL